jgi:hypothetical protein
VPSLRDSLPISPFSRAHALGLRISPLRGLSDSHSDPPTPCAVGCILSPSCGRQYGSCHTRPRQHSYDAHTKTSFQAALSNRFTTRATENCNDFLRQFMCDG